MKQKPDFQQISRQELRNYVLSHREDDEALRIYMKRMRTEPGVFRYTGSLNQEDINQLEQLLKKRVDDHLERQ